MNTPNDGGPIAPTMIQEVPVDSDGTVMQAKMLPEGGLSIRDYFAATSLPGIIDACKADPTQDDESIPQMLARKAYALADAMIVAREDTAEDVITSATWTPRATLILADAAAIAKRYHYVYVGSEHILAAMIGQKGIASLILERRGITLADIEKECGWISTATANQILDALGASSDPLAEITRQKESWQAQTVELENQLVELRRERDRLRQFVNSIVDVNGPYPYLDQRQIVADAYQALNPTTPSA